MTIANNRTITAHDLLLGFLDLRGMTPNFDNWTEELLSDNPPRLFRRRQLVALFQAFGIPWDPQSFVEGKFIHSEHHRYDSLLSKLSVEFPEEMNHSAWTDDVRLPRFFATLFSYRMRVERVLSFSDLILTASGLFKLAYDKICELNGIIQNNIVNIDDILAALISPEMAAFPIEQIVRDYGYPDVNLCEIDGDWW
ncbi:MAG: hypothetical protein HY881_15245 [Deltaproteobacteria bacterium]|nr:hypothetical protein [Deltaproteobacteria bacterium]